MKPRVALLTSMVDFSPAYSLNGVVLDHARMLLRAGWDFDLLAIKNFNQKDKVRVEAEGISVKTILPQTTLVDYMPHDSPRPTKDGEVGFEDQVDRHANGHDGAVGYLEALEPYDVICSHDLMFLSWHLPQNAALRRAIDKWPEKNWLHWIHSSPSEAPDGTCYPSTLRYQDAPNSTFVFLNETKRHECALMLNTTHDKIAVVYNPRDLRDILNFSKETCDLVDHADLMNHEILQVYPYSTPRHEPKGVEKLLRIFACWKDMGLKAKLVLVNAHANTKGVDEVYVNNVTTAANAFGLKRGRDYVVTSLYAEEKESDAKRRGDKDDERRWRHWTHCVPHQVVRELSMLANVFVFPSESECCSLIQAEAAATCKFMVLNSNFQAMAEFAHEGTLQFPFSDNDPMNVEFYSAVAREAWSKLQTETAILNATKARTTVYNRDWIWRRQLEPLLWRKFSGKKKSVSRPVAAAPPCGSARDTSPPAGREALKAEGRIVLASDERPALRERIVIKKPEIETVSSVAEEIVLVEREVDYTDPQPGDVCPIYGSCSTPQREACYKTAEHCPVMDELHVEKVDA
jgi:hypothetical protein